MKKVFFFILAVLYISSSCDASVYLHYCMGKQVSFGFIPENSGTCHRCGMKKAAKGMGCCKDEQKIIKSDKSQKVTDLVSSYKQQIKFITVLTGYNEFSIKICKPSNFTLYPSHGPPPDIGLVPKYIMNRVFLI